MKRIDLEKAAEAEAFGALAVGADRKHRGAGIAGAPFTPVQSRALSDLVHSLVHVAREAGADQNRITVGSVSLELQENGLENILSIRTGTGFSLP